jgi:ATP-dependent Lhr-like helicase
MDDLQSGVNAAEMAKRRFRDIAVISGLAFQGFPGKRQGVKHLQSHSGLLFEVFRDFDADNLLLRQAYDELLDQQMEWSRLRGVLERMHEKTLLIRRVAQPTPFAFPLVVDRLRDRMSSEQLEDRIRKMMVQTGA